MPNRSPIELIPGQKLSDDVYNLDGKRLFAVGTELNEERIEILMMWGVEKVSIDGSEDSSDSVSVRRISDTVKHDAEIVVQERFKLVKSSHPVVAAMREIAVIEAAKSSDRPHNQS
ncbi:hypothetical protein VDG1235_1743 [Verrucomicrobiia bacterium DG1235]|nr:hypothetical protein VDG1235_1743 [Verrucomicrobiae bacterium DG1235]